MNNIFFWIIKLIIGALFLWLVKRYFYQPIRDYIKSYFVIKLLLRETRPTRNALKGKYLADRLLDIWNNGNQKPLISRNVQYSKGDFWQGVWSENIVDEKLKNIGLAETFEEKGIKQVRLSKNSLTKFVINRLNNLVKRNLL